jgi:transposase
MQYVGLDWAYRRASWCALSESGAIAGEGVVPADEDGLVRLVLRLGVDVRACVEMMSGAIWVRDQLSAAGWNVEVAHARKVRDVAPLACKTDTVDARVLAELCRRDLVPALWVPSLEERALREQLRRRMHLVRLRTSAMNRIFGLLTQWGLRVSLDRLRSEDAMELLADRGVEEHQQTDFTCEGVDARASVSRRPSRTSSTTTRRSWASGCADPRAGV